MFLFKRLVSGCFSKIGIPTFVARRESFVLRSKALRVPDLTPQTWCRQLTIPPTWSSFQMLQTIDITVNYYIQSKKNTTPWKQKETKNASPSQIQAQENIWSKPQSETHRLGLGCGDSASPCCIDPSRDVLRMDLKWFVAQTKNFWCFQYHQKACFFKELSHKPVVLGFYVSFQWCTSPINEPLSLVRTCHENEGSQGSVHLSPRLITQTRKICVRPATTESDS